MVAGGRIQLLVSPKPPVTITGDAGAGRHQEWLKFLRVIDDVTPRDKDLHLIADNYATHKHPKVQRWLGPAPSVPCVLHSDEQFVA